MKKMLFILSLSLMSTGVFAQGADDVLTVNAEVIEPLSIDCSDSLELGAFVSEYGVSSALSTDALERAGDVSNAGDLGSCIVDGGGASAFTMAVTDDAGSSAADVATITDGTDSLEVALIEAGGSVMDGVEYNLVAGTLTISIDGSIAAGSTVGAGAYTGSATVDVSY
jgi:hypothetical protein